MISSWSQRDLILVTNNDYAFPLPQVQHNDQTPNQFLDHIIYL